MLKMRRWDQTYARMRGIRRRGVGVAAAAAAGKGEAVGEVRGMRDRDPKMAKRVVGRAKVVKSAAVKR